MKQVAIAALISFGVLALLAAGGFLLIHNGSSGKVDAPAPAASSATPVPQPAVVTEPQEEFNGSASDPITLSDEMREFDVQLYLHEMTHNKVYADVKRGSRPLTSDSIARLIEIVEKNSYRDEKFYLETLAAWQEGNFSNAVEVHNTIWGWHGGTVGKATRLMTPQEEQNYANAHFQAH